VHLQSGSDLIEQAHFSPAVLLSQLVFLLEQLLDRYMIAFQQCDGI
jgi:hypothetical protein